MPGWYRSLARYKYQTLDEIVYETGWNLPRRQSVATDLGWVHLSGDGRLTIRRGYCWNGASGPTLDTASTMRASLVHDALYQILREGLLPPAFRLRADACLERIMLRDYRGSWPKWHAFRVSCWVWVLKHFAGYAAAPDDS
jgi:hypothetical protein